MKKYVTLLLLFFSISIIIISVFLIFKEDKKILLEIEHHDEIDTKQEEVLKEKNILFEVKPLEETKEIYNKKISEYQDDNFKEILNYIEKDLDIKFNSNWRYTISYYDDNKTSGMIGLNYYINDFISTNKSITLSIEDNKIKKIYYMCLDGTVNEEKIIEKYNNFKDTHIQEEITLKENETFYEDSTTYTYFYNIDKLIYNYVGFTLYKEVDIEPYTLNYGSTYIVE